MGGKRKVPKSYTFQKWFEYNSDTTESENDVQRLRIQPPFEYSPKVSSSDIDEMPSVDNDPPFEAEPTVNISQIEPLLPSDDSESNLENISEYSDKLVA